MPQSKLSLKDAQQLIKLARSAIAGKEISLDGFNEKQGVFVTLNSYPSKQLRGCIGFPMPAYRLKKAVAEAAKAAAYEDPRFPPLGKQEKFLVEISVLTVPELIRTNPLKSFKIGQHGLIINYDGKSGLLLPQVFPEWKANNEKALEMTCEKAGLDKDSWKRKDCKVYKFEAQIFIEETPEGKVKQE